MSTIVNNRKAACIRLDNDNSGRLQARASISPPQVPTAAFGEGLHTFVLELAFAQITSHIGVALMKVQGSAR
jgi:hypothetical protein